MTINNKNIFRRLQKNIAPILDKQSKSELGKSYKELNKKA